MGNSHKGWAIYNFRNKKQRLQGKYLSMHRLLLPAKESFKGRSGQYFLGNNPLRRTQPFGCLELFSFKIPNLPQGVISVFRAFKQISSPTKVIITYIQPQKTRENFVNESTHDAGIIYSAWWVWELVSYVRCWYTQCHQFWATVSKIFPYILKYFCPRRSVLWLTFLVNTVQYFVNILVFFSKVCVQNDSNLLKAG